MIFDASVVVKWIVEEERSAEARAASALVAAPAAPAHIIVETGRALPRHVRRGSITGDHALGAIRGVTLSVELIPTETLIDDAFRIALDASVTIYHALYVTAALQRDCALITADARMVEGINRSTWWGRAILLQDFPSLHSRNV